MAAEGTRLASKQASKQASKHSIIVPFFPVKLNFIQTIRHILSKFTDGICLFVLRIETNTKERRC